MAWNKPNEKVSVQRATGWPAPATTLLAGSLLVASGIGGWLYYASSGGRGSTATSKANKALIQAVTPATSPSAATTSPPPPPRKKYKDLTREEKLQYYKDKYGDNLPDNLKPIVYYLENEPKVNYRGRTDITSVFKRHSERTIAAFLRVEPGSWVMKPVQFGEKFDRDLALALEEKIEINDDDSDEVRKLKEAVIDAKSYLGEEAKKGKSPSAIISEASQELYTLGQYKRDLENEIRAIKNDPTKSDDDLSLAVEAANQMLAKKGLKPLRQPNMLIRYATLKRAQKRLQQKQRNKE